MPCDTELSPGQTMRQRIKEIQDAAAALDRRLKKRLVKPVIGPQGAITFTGWPDNERNKVTDACAYRRIMASGSMLAKAEIMRAEQLAGRSVDRKVIAQGIHSHDGGATWHGKG